jgi:Zn-dependent protease with chaperone function
VAALSFFAQQERARRASLTLFVLYAISVAAIVAAVNGIVWATVRLFGYSVAQNIFVITPVVTLAVIALGTVEILARLSLSRGELAALLSGRPIGRGSVQEDERRLVNIVDEMSIASGLPAPPLYVLHREQGINAFAAGEVPSQAVIIVTRGALEKLSRDELQAVIAHEFSHILNGDIRLNLRAVYVLQGIVFLSAIGRFMMQYFSGAGTEEGRRFFHLPFALLGVGVFAVGSVGLVFCRVIQASLSRERETLADACAVQFTRNADALCGALARIQVAAEGSGIRNWHADALAHMLFAPVSDAGWRALIATHPPIEERMRRINPHASPGFYFEKARTPRAEDRKKASESGHEQEKEKPKTIVPRRATGVAALIAAIGTPGVEHLEYATSLLSYLSPSIREALGDAEGAQAVMLGCLLDSELTNRERQLRALREHCDESLARKAEVLAPVLKELDRAYRLPLVALAVPTLKGLAAPERAKFMAALRAAIQADGRITLGEFVLSTILGWTLLPPARRAVAASAEAALEIAQILSLVAHAGNENAAEAQAAFDKGAAILAFPGLTLTPKEALRLAQSSQALSRASGLPAADKARLLEACATAVAADDNVRLMEHELLRAVACVLDCPMPPAIAALDPRLLRK